MVEKIAQLIREAKHTVALTGAGISVPSGIHAFRSHGGLWTTYPIEEYGTIQAFRRDPYKVWRLFKAISGTVDTAQPNAGHKALAWLEQMGLLQAVITQNIDWLHQRAGSKNVIEFHGSAGTYTCLSCHARYPREETHEMLDDDGIPHCTCDTPLKPDIILFGESIPQEGLREAYSHAHRADLILVIGTSAQVAPASMLPPVVASHGGKIVEFNLEHTSLTSSAHVHAAGDASRTLPALVEAVENPD